MQINAIITDDLELIEDIYAENGHVSHSLAAKSKLLETPRPKQLCNMHKRVTLSTTTTL